MTETEYWHKCNLLSIEIDDALAIYHTYEQIHQLQATNKTALAVLNADVLFWKVQLYCLKTSLFIVLGRIFDPAPDAHSIQKLVRATQDHPEFFSRDAIANRKSSGGSKPEWLDDYLMSVWIVEPTTLRALRKELLRYVKRFEDIYRPIRNQIYAHKLLGSDESIYELFQKTNRKDVEDILHFLRDLMYCIENLYLNGNEPVLGLRSFDNYRENIRESTRSVFEKIVSGMERRHSALTSE